MARLEPNAKGKIMVTGLMNIIQAAMQESVAELAFLSPVRCDIVRANHSGRLVLEFSAEGGAGHIRELAKYKGLGEMEFPIGVYFTDAEGKVAVLPPDGWQRSH